MYIFHLLPTAHEDWHWQPVIGEDGEIDPDIKAFSLNTPEEGSNSKAMDTDKTEWFPFRSFSQGYLYRRSPYIYTPAILQASSDPSVNYLGAGGDDTWLKARLMHDFECINRTSTGYTTREDSSMVITAYPSRMLTESDARAYLSGLETHLKSYWTDQGGIILQGIFAKSVTVECFTFDGTLLHTETHDLRYLSGESLVDNTMLTWQNLDSPYDGEYPSRIPVNQMIMPFRFDGRDNVYKIVITLNNPQGSLATTSLRGCYFFYKYKCLGQTSQKNIQLGAIDYSRLTYDDYGRITIIKGKSAKTISAEVNLTNIDSYASDTLLSPRAYDDEKVLRSLQGSRATPTFFVFENDFGASLNNLANNVSPLMYETSSILGIIKNMSINDSGVKTRTLNISVDGIPAEYILD